MAATTILEQLSEPITVESPGGTDLEATEAAVTALRSRGIIGTQTGIRDPKLDWRALRKEIVEKRLDKSRDLRFLPYLAAAQLKIDGFQAFLEIFDVARSWFEHFPNAVHPLVEDDFNPRENALADWQDSFAIVEPLRQSVVFGNVTVADLLGYADSRRADARSAESSGVRAALGAADERALMQLLGALDGALASIHQIEMRVGDKPEDINTHGSLGRLKAILSHAQEALNDELNPESKPAPVPGSAADGKPIGSITSRADAIRALQEVQRFFTTNEPSSPVPLLVDRAVRLVDRPFLAVIEDLLPNSVSEARRAAGVPESK